MKFTGTGTPPTESEIQTAIIKNKLQKKRLVTRIISIATSFVLFIGTFAYLDIGGMTSLSNAAIHLSIILTLLLKMIDTDEEMLSLLPIAKDKCVWLAFLLDEPGDAVADYCKQVAEQGREIVGAEYNAIVQSQNERLDALNQQKQEVACKKVYALT